MFLVLIHFIYNLKILPYKRQKNQLNACSWVWVVPQYKIKVINMTLLTIKNPT